MLKFRMNLVLLFILSHPLLSLAKTAKIRPSLKPHISVLLAKALTDITVSGTNLRRTLFQTGNVKAHQGPIKVKFLCPPTLKKSKTLLAQVDSPTGILAWNEGLYRGDMLVAKSSDEGCQLIQRSSLEDYISSLLAKEMNRLWPLEALKAQAVAARTYALYQMNQRKHERFYDLENSERDQVNGGLNDESSLTIRAAQETKGEVLLNPQGQLRPIFYHSKCGGKTFLPVQIWDRQEAGYVSVKCPFCLGHGESGWQHHLNPGEFKKLIKRYGKNGKVEMKDNVLFHPDRKENQLLRVNMNGKLGLLNKIYLRRFLGRDKIKSNYFTVKQVNKDVVIEGTGNGHGVGMCQFGALAMADMGWDYKKILKYYYPKHELKTYY